MFLSRKRNKRKMTEEECRKKERQKSFQQKYRLTQRFIEDSIKGNATNLEIAKRELRNAQLGSLQAESEDLTRKNLLSDSEVFLDTDDDGMDTISEITIDFGGRNTRHEFEINKDSLGKHFVDF